MTTITETALDTGSFPSKPSHIKWHELPTPKEPLFPLPPPLFNPTKILDADKGTPDDHVPRDPRLIRLTGVHPFNVEPPLTALYNEGTYDESPLAIEHESNLRRLPHTPRIVLCTESWSSTAGSR